MSLFKLVGIRGYSQDVIIRLPLHGSTQIKT